MTDERERVLLARIRTLEYQVGQLKFANEMASRSNNSIDGAGGFIPQHGALSFRRFQAISALRSRSSYNKRCIDWNLTDWSNAIAGEVGELCGETKKIRRGDNTLDEVRGKILKELADVITYSIIMLNEMGESAARIMLDKFNEVSARPAVGFPRIVQFVIDNEFKPKQPSGNPDVCRCGASKYDPYCYCEA